MGTQLQSPKGESNVQSILFAKFALYAKKWNNDDNGGWASKNIK